jgi:pantothenate kinase
MKTGELEFAGLAELVRRIEALQGTRVIVALAGPPGAGKSSLADVLEAKLNDASPGTSEVIPMDGFHYDNVVLKDWGLLDTKGSPQTFDVGGFASMLGRLRRNSEKTIAVPIFDRDKELSRAGARVVPSNARILVVEGNYLLLDSPPWNQLRSFFDLTVMIKEDRAILRKRLITRWLAFGYDESAAIAKAVGNDLPNADLVLQGSRLADFEITSSKRT